MSDKNPDPYHLDELERRRSCARAQGGPEKIERQHSLGRLTARERIDELLDDGSFEGIGLLAHSDRPEARARTPADGKVCGYGKVDGRGVYVSADDVTVMDHRKALARRVEPLWASATARPPGRPRCRTW